MRSLLGLSSQSGLQYRIARPTHRVRRRLVVATADKNIVKVVKTEKPKWHTENGLVVPVAYPQLLGLRGRSLYLEAQIAGSYEEQMASPLDEGYSEVALLAKEKLLLMARDGMRAARGRVSNMHLETTIDPILLPGAMALLERGGFYDLVMQLGQQTTYLDERDLRAANKETVQNFHRDVALAAALAHCGLAHQALKRGQIALGCGRLEEALEILKAASAGSIIKGSVAPLAPELQERIEAALMDFKADAVLNYLQGPLNLTGGAALRPQAVAALSIMLAKPETAARSDGSQPITPEFVATALESLTSDEICGLLDWEKIATHKTAHTWYYSSLLPLVGLAHIVSGFVHRRPSTISLSQRILSHATSEADVAVHTAVASLLLGAAHRAVAIIKEDDRIGAALRGEAPTGTPNAINTARAMSKGPIPFPNRDGILEYIQLYSPDAEGDLTPGLCVFVEAWLARLAFAKFRDTRAQPPSASIAAYLDDPMVMAGIASQAAAGAALAKLKLPAVQYALVGLAIIVTGVSLFGGRRGAGNRLSAAADLKPKVAAGVKPAPSAVGSKLSTLSVAGDVELTRDVVRHIIEQWLRIKADALGPRHKTNQLSTVLVEPMLGAVKAESDEAAHSGWFWNIKPLKVKIEKIEHVANGKKNGSKATVLAIVEEQAEMWASNGRKGDSYKTAYKVEYNLVKSGGQWKIGSALVLGR